MHIFNPELVSGQTKVDSWVTVTSILVSTVSFGFIEGGVIKDASGDFWPPHGHAWVHAHRTHAHTQTDSPSERTPSL